ncbi:MAG: ammonium transporter [Hyphomicrobiaceae bacterium]|nr:ammonium transporter [Hyphomicrobiaceae bacterium]
MTFDLLASRARTLAAAGLLSLAATPALAAPEKADTGFMFLSTVLVLLMTIPGLALFYGGLVRAKNMLSVLMQVFAITCVIAIVWLTYGYSLAFTGSGGELNAFIGGLSKAFLGNIKLDAEGATFSNGVYIYEYSFIAFQMTFACITPALIVGAFAERMKFSALLIFSVLWVTLVYFPMAHMVWYWGGPDVFGNAAKALADATAGGDAAKIAEATAALDAVKADVGYLFGLGALDFAGGTVVHINAGIAGLVGAILVGRRVGYGREAMPPHSLTMTMIGAALLWVGWFGFNCGSNLEASVVAVLAMLNTFAATAAAGVAWMLIEWMVKGKPSLLGLASGVVAGLVAVTPAAGFAGVMGSLVLGLVAGVVCFFFSTAVKNALGYDDSLDVFGIHGIGGIIGAIGTGILANPALGGAGIPDYITKPGELYVSETYDTMGQVMIQAQAVGVTIVWCGLVSLVLFKLIDWTIGLRRSTDQEREGLDLVDHGERAYSY